MAGPRFGDCALELGAVDRVALNAAAARQTLAALVEPGDADRLALGWAPAGFQAQGQRWPWVAVAMADEERAALIAAARRCDCPLGAVLPLHGSAAGCLESEADGLVVQSHHGLLAVTALRRGQGVGERLVGLSGVVPTASDLEAHVLGHRGVVWCCGDGLDGHAVARLAAETGLDCRIFADPDGDSAFEHPGDPCLLGALRLARGQGPVGLAAAVALADERIPAWRQRRWWLAAAAALAVASHLAPGLVAAQVRARLAAADAAIRRAEDASSPIQDPRAAAKQELRRRLSELEARRRERQEAGAGKGGPLATLPAALAAAVPSGVVVDSLGASAGASSTAQPSPRPAPPTRGASMRR